MMGILDELFRRKPEDEFLPEYAKPADPLRKLRDAIPENKDSGLSMLNMIRSALGTSANWLDGTKDPSLIGPQEMVSPLGLAGMGMAMAPKAAATSPKTWYHGTRGDFDKFNTPEVYFSSKASEASGYGDKVIPAHVKSDNPLRYDGGNLWMGSPPQAVIDDLIKQAREKGHDSVVVKVPAYAGEFHQAPAREHMIAINPGTVSHADTGATLFADNARSSAPGTVVNSVVESRGRTHINPYDDESFDIVFRAGGDDQGKAKLFREPGIGAYLEDVSVKPEMRRKGIASQMYDDAQRYAKSEFGDELVPSAGLSNDGLAFWAKRDPNALLKSLERNRDRYPAGSGDRAHYDEQIATARGLIKSSPSASAPGLAANSSQQTKDASELSEPMLMELLRRLEGGA